jgi:hypothetical protein
MGEVGKTTSFSYIALGMFEFEALAELGGQTRTDLHRLPNMELRLHDQWYWNPPISKLTEKP